MKKKKKSYLEVNLRNVSDNIKKIQEKVGKDVTVAPVIKADAYGLGAVYLKEVLKKRNISIIIVATIEEAIVLRESGFDMEILILNELLPFEAEDVIKYNLTVRII